MNVLNRLSIFVITSIFLSSCGYSSYDECVKEEIKSNNNKVNNYILNYCADEHPKSPKIKEYILKDSEIGHKLTNSGLPRANPYSVTDDQLEITNRSDYNIDILKVNFECTEYRFINWKKMSNLLPGKHSLSPGETFTIRDTEDWEIGCYSIYAVHKY